MSDAPGLPYTSLSSFLKRRFKAPVTRIPLDPGFPCPNRDGTKGTGGCAFCSPESFSGNRGGRMLPIGEQIESAMNARQRRGHGLFIAYFQQGTCTNAPLPEIASAVSAACAEGPVAISIGTRPDCVPDPVLDLLAGFAGEREIWLELGAQTSNDQTLAAMGRGHDFATFADAARRAATRGIEVVAHVILGLPGEDREHAQRTARDLARLPISGVKIHDFYVARGAKAEEWFHAGLCVPPTPHAHALMAADFLERIPAMWPVHRLVSDPAPDTLVAPSPRIPKQEALRLIVEEMNRRGARQGSLTRAGAG